MEWQVCVIVCRMRKAAVKTNGVTALNSNGQALKKKWTTNQKSQRTSNISTESNTSQLLLINPTPECRCEQIADVTSAARQQAFQRLEQQLKPP